MNNLMIRIVLFFLVSGMTSVQATTDKVKILSSIKPVQLIVSAIAGGNAQVLQLIPDNASVHTYSFRPSDIRKIKEATIVFRIDEHLEAIVSSALEQYVPVDKLISLAEQDGIHLLNISSASHRHDNSHNYEHENTDLHIWTSPKNVMIMAQVIASKLSEVDPKNTKTYYSNLKLFESRVRESSQKIKLELSEVRDKPYMVIHNSWHYFADFFGLREPEILSFHEGLGENIKSILNARRSLKENRIGCIIGGLNTSPDYLATLTKNMPIKTLQIDVLGSKTPMDENSNSGAYIQLLEAMAEKIHRCLSY